MYVLKWEVLSLYVLLKIEKYDFELKPVKLLIKLTLCHTLLMLTVFHTPIHIYTYICVCVFDLYY